MARIDSKKKNKRQEYSVLCIVYGHICECHGLLSEMILNKAILKTEHSSGSFLQSFGDTVI